HVCSRLGSALLVWNLGARRDTPVSARLGEGRERLHRHVRGERVADSPVQHGPREEGAAGQGHARRPDGGRRDGGLVVRKRRPPDPSRELPDRWQLDPSSRIEPPSPGVYALSIPGVKPTACITWFQANQACLLSGKRLLTNREWQGAATGTPDPGTRTPARRRA